MLAARRCVRSFARVPHARALSAGAYRLPELPYAYDALEPHISRDIMELHHSKHHQKYVTELNAALERLKSAEQAGDVAEMIAAQHAIKFNGGGHINHSVFFRNLGPQSAGGGEPPAEGSELAGYINSQFGSFEDFKKEMNAKCASIQGSGWGWLGYNASKDRVEIATCPNQDPLYSTTGLVPLLGIDMWEHAFYLDYKNVKGEYLEAIWNVVNFNDVADRLSKAKQAAKNCASGGAV